MSLLLKRRFKKENEKHPLSPSMTVNVNTIQSIIGQSEDVTIRHFSLGKEPKVAPQSSILMDWQTSQILTLC
ncbi:hypothetical protein [Geomicrobium sp. JCM 19038]|uniref:hypothetical protein n=1 Tax=Geomicrobium sp. JCM 19038 TaxID=1460635 RepID=UPI0006942D71|nr:hypothetical protein [Geomicrobium sp. JCM 19038]